VPFAKIVCRNAAKRLDVIARKLNAKLWAAAVVNHELLLDQIDERFGAARCERGHWRFGSV
jgi:hypothetical protein